MHGVDADQVFAANGSNEVLQSICLAYGGAGRKAAMFEPTYALHSHIAHLTGTRLVQGERRPDFTLDAGAAVELIETEHPSIVFLCSPNNPTGLAEDESTVQRGRRSRHRALPWSTRLMASSLRGPPSSWSARMCRS